MHLFLKLFVQHKEKYIFGPGRVELLQAVDELGSLRKAAQQVGMSYRWAWGRIKDVEEALNVPLLMDDPNNKRRTKVLTPQAKELLQWFLATEHTLQQTMLEAEKSRPAFLQKNWRI